MKLLEMAIEGEEWRGLVEFTTGFLWWKRYHRAQIWSSTGIIWQWCDHPGWVDPYRVHPHPERVVDYMERKHLRSWKAK